MKFRYDGKKYGMSETMVEQSRPDGFLFSRSFYENWIGELENDTGKEPVYGFAPSTLSANVLFYYVWIVNEISV